MVTFRTVLHMQNGTNCVVKFWKNLENPPVLVGMGFAPLAPPYPNGDTNIYHFHCPRPLQILEKTIFGFGKFTADKVGLR